MAFLEMISKEEYEKGTKFKPHKYKEIYKELEKMEEGQCARKECDSEREATALSTSMKRTFERNSDDSFEVSKRGRYVYIRRVK